MIKIRHKKNHTILHVVDARKLEGARMQCLVLGEADLQGARMRGADLQHVYLRGANLECADLRGADLEGADLRGARLVGADLRGANLRNAELCGAQYDMSTRWPTGFDARAQRAWLVQGDAAPACFAPPVPFWQHLWRRRSA
ncbi:MAG TPA: pentapeptide repeat-containing protein [Armatimonadota bacterium]|nr:pentapeptide repeat-containing protein [Armatimonadota bacterium]